MSGADNEETLIAVGNNALPIPRIHSPTSEALAEPRATEHRQVSTSWFRDRSALPVDLFRVLAGLVLTVHFARQISTVPALLGPEGLYDPTLVTQIGGRVVWGYVFGMMPRAAIVAWLGLCTCLAALVTIGWRPRLCAAVLLVLSVDAFWGLFPATVFEDRIANLILLWLVLLRTGHTLQLWRVKFGRAFADTWRDWQSQWVPGPTIAVFGCQLVLTYLLIALASASLLASAPWISGVLLGVVAGVVAPWRIGRVLALALWGALHWSFYSHTGLLGVSIVLYAATLVLLSKSRTAVPESSPGIHVTPSAILGGTLVAVLGLNLAGAALHMSGPWRSTARVLADLGVSPTSDSLIGDVRVTALRVQSDNEDPNHSATTYAVSLTDAREQVLADLFVAEATSALDTIRTRIARRHADHFCQHNPRFRGTAQLLLERSDGVVTPRAWLSCSADAGPARKVVLLAPRERGAKSL